MVAVTAFLLEALSTGLSLFISPFIHFEMLWVALPVLLNFLFTEYFQEKKGTSWGNAMTNGFVAFWVGMDWTRNLIVEYSGLNPDSLFKISLCAFMYSYGILILSLQNV